jgi:RNA polymerase subunit RPABC4/transcription elongation factor Spt4
MAAIACGACGKLMNSQAVVCPHCNARRGASAGDAKLSTDEVRALLVLNTAKSDRSPPPASVLGLALPQRDRHGLLPLADVLLTIVCAPLILIGLVSVAFMRVFSRMRRRAAERDLPGASSGIATICISGGFGLFMALRGHGSGLALAVVVVEIVLLLVRTVLRARNTSSHSLTT